MLIKRSEPAERAYFDEFVVPLLGDDVVVIDQPPHEVKVDLMGRARALVFPIDWPEPFGLVMTEAMACGTPVITRPLGAAPEIVTEGVTGFLLLHAASDGGRRGGRGRAKTRGLPLSRREALLGPGHGDRVRGGVPHRVGPDEAAR